ncbi:hypothetical protein SB717_39720, partial [Priestia sp. SIMBA_032]|uniref:hypothetical protein n=1 Tax=Priestia sp. SIMBA_032 TaxID=3085775 RepID=UPI003978F42F
GHGGREAGSAGAGDGFARKPSPARRAVSAPQRAAAATVARRANLVARPPEALIRHWVERRGRDPLPVWEAFDPREIT